MSSWPHYIGIDNGLSGGTVVAYIKANDSPPIPVRKYAHRSIPRPDGNHLDSGALRNWLEEAHSHMECEPRVVLEEPAKGQGRNTTATAIGSTFCSYGRVCEVLEHLGWPYLTVTASRWQAALWGKKGCYASLPNESKPSLRIAPALWPQFDWRKSELGKKPYDGITDAYMLTFFGVLYWDIEFDRRKEANRKIKAAAKRKRERRQLEDDNSNKINR